MSENGAPKGRRERKRDTGPAEIGRNETAERLVSVARGVEGLQDLAVRLAVLAESTRAGLLVETAHRRVALTNQPFCDLFKVPLTPSQMVGSDCGDFTRGSKLLFADPDGFERRVDALIAGGKASLGEDLKLADGRVFQRDYLPLHYDGAPRGHVWQYEDVTAERSAAQAAARRAKLQEIERRVLGALFEDRGVPRAIDLLLGEVGEVWGLASARIVRQLASESGLVESVEWQRGEPLRRGGVASVSWLETAAGSAITGARVVRAEGADLGGAGGLRALVWGMRSDGHGSAFVVPVFVYGRPEAVAYFAVSDPRRPWPDDECATIQATVDGLARALERRVVERERRVHGQELSSALARAESASRFKSQFVAYLSHEIRNPIGAILGYADQLGEPDPTSERNLELSSHLRRNAQHLLTLLNDVLDLSRVEAGQLDLRTSEQDLALLVGDVVMTMRDRAASKGVLLQARYESDVPRPFETDPTRFKQILINLVGNALKFTDTGKVEIRVRVEQPEGKARATLVLDVEDTGIGIPPDRIGALFMPFAQAHEDSHSKHGGAGLGLAISRNLARLLGGDITVASVVGRGTTFTVRLDLGPVDLLRLAPASTAAPSPTPRRPATVIPPSLSGRRMLFADDTEDNHRIVHFHLERAGVRLDHAYNGKECLERVAAAEQAGEPYETILLDLQMPVMDGLEAASELRARGLKTPIVALTAHSAVEEKERSRTAGCDAFASKPVDPALLFELLASFFERGSGDAAPRPTQPLSRLAATAPTTTATEGAAANAAAIESTTSEAGATDIAATAARPNGSAAPSAGESAQAASNGDRRPSTPLPSATPLRSTMSDDPAFAPLLARYVREIRRRAGDLRERWAAGDAAGVAQLAHQIKGSGASYGFEPLTELAGRLEKRLRSGGDEDPAALVESLARAIEAVELR